MAPKAAPPAGGAAQGYAGAGRTVRFSNRGLSKRGIYVITFFVFAAYPRRAATVTGTTARTVEMVRASGAPANG